jgi:hypothetical protein
MTKSQVNSFSRCLIAVCALYLGGVSTKVEAQLPGPHPEYLHAIRDLREARALLQSSFVQPNQIATANAAIPLITQAINDLKSASNMDAKNLGDVPPPKSVSGAGPFHDAEALLDSAHHEIKMPESDPVARPYQDRALVHIDNARNAIRPIL